MSTIFRPLAAALSWCAWSRRLLVACALAAAVMTDAVGEDVVESLPAPDEVPGGVFLPADDGRTLWEQTLATVAAEWPVVRVTEPDFMSVPPRAGMIESAWVEPSGGGQATWVPRRQRVVVRVVPAVAGAWIDAVVQDESLSGTVADGRDGEPMGGLQPLPHHDSLTIELAARLAPTAEPVYALPPVGVGEAFPSRSNEPPWAGSRFPRLSRAGHKVVQDYRNFYAPDSIVRITAAFGAGAVMANTGFDETMQTAWQRGVTPSSVGDFLAEAKDIGEGRYAVPIFAVASVTGVALEGNPAGDAIGEWGSRSLRIFTVGAPPLALLQIATGGSRPVEEVGSEWRFFGDSNGVSGHTFVGAIPFLAAADMVENPLLKGALYVGSTFVGFSRMTDNAHFPSQVFLGWYLAWASARAVDNTEIRFAGMELEVMPLPIGDLGGVGVTGRW